MPCSSSTTSSDLANLLSKKQARDNAAAALRQAQINEHNAQQAYLQNPSTANLTALLQAIQALNAAEDTFNTAEQAYEDALVQFATDQQTLNSCQTQGL